MRKNDTLVNSDTENWESRFNVAIKCVCVFSLIMQRPSNIPAIGGLVQLHVFSVCVLLNVYKYLQSAGRSF